ncbi:MAG: AhpC/TSA family protein [Deltaproteobacteria bacterium]|nr:AhpC/TSA family protein [Deltaproteobacteria bacterium]
MKATKDQVEARGVSIIVISFAEPHRLAQYQKYHQWPFVILADPKRTAYDAFALKRLSWFQVFSPATLKLYWRLLREGKKREDYSKDDIYQSGGDFLIDRDGNVLFAHPSRDPADRPTAMKLLEIIDRKLPPATPLTR